MRFERAAEQACKALSIEKGSKVAIITDFSREFFAKELATKAKEKGARVRYFVMEHWGRRPYKIPVFMLDAFKDADAGFVISEFRKGELPIFRKPLYEIPYSNKKLRLATMPDITEQILNEAMLADFSEVEKFSRKVYSLLSRAREITVMTEKGTHLKAVVGKYKWVKSTGIIRRGTWNNLPSGEVFTTPESIEGKAVVDGYVGGYIDEKCGNCPVTMEIKNSRIISVKCKNKILKQKIIENINTDKNSSRIGEFALGTNIFIKHLIGNCLQDEKFPGVHFANGDPIGEDTGAEWKSNIHTDYILMNSSVYLDGKKIMEKGNYLIK